MDKNKFVSWKQLEKVFKSIGDDFIEDRLEHDDPICICTEIRHRLKKEAEF